MKTMLLTAAAVAAALAATHSANATTYTYTITDFAPNVVSGGSTAPVTGTMTLDVTGGQVTSGSASLTGSLFGSGSTLFDLVTTNNYCGNTCTGWRSGNGDDWFGSNTNFPIDTNGLTFHSSTWGSGYVFGVYSASGGGAGAPYQGALFGASNASEFWGYDQSLTLTLTPAPEPATWAMLTAGFAALGMAAFRRARDGRALALG